MLNNTGATKRRGATILRACATKKSARLETLPNAQIHSNSLKFLKVCLFHVLCDGVEVTKEDYDDDFMPRIHRS